MSVKNTTQSLSKITFSQKLSVKEKDFIENDLNNLLNLLTVSSLITFDIHFSKVNINNKKRSINEPFIELTVSKYGLDFQNGFVAYGKFNNNIVQLSQITDKLQFILNEKGGVWKIKPITIIGIWNHKGHIDSLSKLIQFYEIELDIYKNIYNQQSIVLSYPHIELDFKELSKLSELEKFINFQNEIEYKLKHEQVGITDIKVIKSLLGDPYILEKKKPFKYGETSSYNIVVQNMIWEYLHGKVNKNSVHISDSSLTIIPITNHHCENYLLLSFKLNNPHTVNLPFSTTPFPVSCFVIIETLFGFNQRIGFQVYEAFEFYSSGNGFIRFPNSVLGHDLNDDLNDNFQFDTIDDFYNHQFILEQERIDIWNKYLSFKVDT